MTSIENSSNNGGPRGAGAILYSSLATAGWRFPLVTLVEADEKHLFDLEVRLKLRQDQSLITLQQAIIDFPGSSVLRRAGIIHVLLDTLSSAYSFADFELNPVTYHPITVLRILRSILQKLKVEFRAMQEGDSVCIFQRPLSSNCDESLQQETQDREDMKLWELQTMRYPGLLMNQDISEIHRNAVEPHLSFSGFAFALCAATLPLLQSKDIGLIFETLRLFQDALPYVNDMWCKDDNMTAIHQKRFQHLLNRFDQIASMPCYGKPNASLFQSLLNQNISAVINHSQIPDIEDHSFSTVYCYLMTLFLHSIPEFLLFSSEPPAKLNLDFGTKVSSVMMKMLLMGPQYLSMFSHLDTIQDFSRLFSRVLTILNPSQMEQQSKAFSIAKSMAFLEQFDANYHSQQQEVSRNVAYFEEILHHVSVLLPLLLENKVVKNTNDEEDHLQHILSELRGYVPILLVTMFSEISTLLSQANEFDVDDDVEEAAEYMTPKQHSQRSLQLFRQHIVHLIGDFYVSIHDRSKDNDHSTKDQLLLMLKEDILLSSWLLHSSDKLFRLFVIDLLQSFSTSDNQVNNEGTIIAAIFNGVFITLSPENIELHMEFYRGNYQWIQLLSWAVNNSNNQNSASNTGKIAQQMFEAVPYPGIERLLAYINKPTIQTEQALLLQKKMLVMGLFHQQSSIRSQSLLALKDILWPSESKDMPSIKWGQTCIDLFDSETSFLTLNNLLNDGFVTGDISPNVYNNTLSKKPLSIVTGTVQSGNSVKTSSFSHVDIQRLVSLSFSVDLDLSIQYSAIQQLTTILLDDITLLRTCPVEWSKDLLMQCLYTLMHYIFDDGTNHLSLEKVNKLTRLQCQYLSSLLHVVYMFSTRHPDCLDVLFSVAPGVCKNSPDYYADSISEETWKNGLSKKKIDVNSFLVVLIDSVQLSRDTVAAVPEDGQSMVQEGKKWLKFAAYIIAELLFISTCHVRNWPLETVASDTTNKSHDFTLTVKYSVGNNNSNCILQVPAFLIKSVVMIPSVSEPFQKLVLSSGDAGADVLLRSLRYYSCPSKGNGTVINNNKNLNVFIEVSAISLNMQNAPILPEMALLQDAWAYSIAWEDNNKVNDHTNDWSLLWTSFGAQWMRASTCHQDVYDRLLFFRTWSTISSFHVDRLCIDSNVPLLASVSTIMSQVPKTKKDFFLLYHLLSMFNLHIQSLLSYFQDTSSAITSTWSAKKCQSYILQQMSELLEVILPVVSLILIPAMSNYATQRHTRYQQLENSGTKASRTKVQDVITQIQHETLVFLSLASQFSMISLTPSVNSPELPVVDLSLGNILFETGLFQFFTNEIFYQESSMSSHRVLWGQTLMHLIENHEGLLLLQALERPNSNGNNMVDDQDILIWTLQRLIRQAKLIRIPDAFQQNAVSLITLQVLHRAVKAVLTSVFVYEVPSANMLSFLQEKEFWLWLVRFLYDRRYEMKVTTLWIMEMLLPLWTAHVEENKKKSVDNTADIQNCSSTEEQQEYQQQWPPLDALYHMAVDVQEASYVRCMCLQLTLQYVTSVVNHRAASLPSTESQRTQWDTPVLGWTDVLQTHLFPMVRYVDVINQLLSLEDAHISYVTLTTLLSRVLQPIISWATSKNKGKLFEEFHMFFQAQKIYPKLLRLFVNDITDDSAIVVDENLGMNTSFLQERLNVLMQARFMASEEAIDNNHLYLNQHKSQGESLLSMGHLGYFLTEETIQRHKRLYCLLNDCIAQICLSFAQVSSLSSTQSHISSAVFADMVHYGALWARTLACSSTMFVHIYVSEEKESRRDRLNKPDDTLTILRLQAFSSCQQLWIYLFSARNLSKASQSSVTNNLNSTKLAKRSIAICTQVLEHYHAYCTETNENMYQNNNHALHALFMKVITQSMHFVCLFLTKKQLKKRSSNDTLVNFFYQLFEYRLSLLSLATSNTDKYWMFSNQIDMTLSYLMEYVPLCRSLVFEYHDTVDTHHLVPRWLESQMQAVISAAETLHAAPSSTASANGIKTPQVANLPNGNNTSANKGKSCVVVSVSKVKPSTSNRKSITVDMMVSPQKHRNRTPKPLAGLGHSVSSTASTLPMRHDQHHDNRETAVNVNPRTRYEDNEEEKDIDDSHLDHRTDISDSLDMSHDHVSVSESSNVFSNNVANTKSNRKQSGSKTALQPQPPVSRPSGTPSFATPVSTAKVRHRARSYQVSPGSVTASVTPPSVATGVTSTSRTHTASSAKLPLLQRVSLCTASMVLKHCVDLLPTSGHGMERTRHLCRALGQLLKFAAQHSFSVNNNTSFDDVSSVSSHWKHLFSFSDASVASTGLGMKSLEASFAMTEGQVAAAIFLLLDSVLQDAASSETNNRLKAFFFRYAEEKPHLLTTANNSNTHNNAAVNNTMTNTQTSLLHYCISLATNASVSPVIRHYCLHSISSILQQPSINTSLGNGTCTSLSPTLRISLSHLLVQQIQRLLRSLTATSTFSNVHVPQIWMLRAYMIGLLSFLCTTEAQTGVSCFSQYVCDTHPTTKQQRGHHVSQYSLESVFSPLKRMPVRAELMAEDSAMLPLPQLFFWTIELCQSSQQMEAVSQALRALETVVLQGVGRLLTVPSTNANPTFTNNLRVLSGFVSESWLSYLLHTTFDPATLTNKDVRVCALAATLLWCLLNQSERAKATVKQLPDYSVLLSFPVQDTRSNENMWAVKHETATQKIRQLLA